MIYSSSSRKGSNRRQIHAIVNASSAAPTPLLTRFTFYIVSVVAAFPFPISQVVPLPLALAIAIVAMNGGLAVAARTRSDRTRLLAAVYLSPALWGLSILVQQFMALAKFGTSFLYIFLLPLAFVAGSALVKLKLEGEFLRSFRNVAILMAVIALWEFATHTSVFGISHFLQNSDRTTAGQFHPIVLGIVLNLAMATCIQYKDALSRVVVLLVLYSAVFTTVSAGPEAVGGAVALVVLFPRLASLGRRVTAIVMVAAVASIFFITSVFTPSVRGFTVDQYSNGYRSAIYALLPQMLSERPLGYGISGMPAGHWYIYTDFLGVRDVSITLDAEPVLLAAEFGVAGIVSYLLIVRLAGQVAYRSSLLVGLALASVTVNGLTVALHSWPSLSILWFLLIGSAWQFRAASGIRKRAGGKGPNSVMQGHGRILSDSSHRAGVSPLWN